MNATTNSTPATKPSPITINGVRVMKKGIRFAGKYVPCWFSFSTYTDGSKAVEIRAKSVCDYLPKELGTVINNSDTMSDYFEKDRVRFALGTPEFKALLPFCYNAKEAAGLVL